MIHQQSVFERWPLEDKSVQAVITSPPYYALRKYDIPDIKIGDWTGQYGLEETYQLYIEHTLLWCKEAWRVLKDDGVFFLNVGDSYSGSCSNGYKQSVSNINRSTGVEGNANLRKEIGRVDMLPSKCLLDIPARVSIALVDNQGWTKRNNIIWFKSNGMPESVTDRFSKKHENIFMFTKQARYYFDLDAVKEKIINPGKPRAFGKKNNSDRNDTGIIYNPDNRIGKNPGDIWEITTQASSEKHFAMWPQNLVKRMVLCSTKSGDIVLDPFVGSGTTIKVAEELGRKGIGIDLGYQDVQKRRLRQIQKPLF